jgi:ribosomal protein L7Ae-like RNA K-turn-binding protein
MVSLPITCRAPHTSEVSVGEEEAVKAVRFQASLVVVVAW